MSQSNPNAIPIARGSLIGEERQNKGLAPGKRYGRSFLDSLERQAVMAWAEQDSRDLRRVIARRLNCSEAEVTRLLIGLMCQHRSEAASFRVGVRSVIDGLASIIKMADAAGRDVWRDGSA